MCVCACLRVCVCVCAYLGLDDEGAVPSDGDLFLHDAEAVEAAEQQAGAVGPQRKVHVVAAEAVLVVRDVPAQVHVDQQEVVELAAVEGLAAPVAWGSGGKNVDSVNTVVVTTVFT